MIPPRRLHEAILTHSITPILLGLAAATLWGAADFAGGLAARRGRPGRVVFVAHGFSVLLLGWLTVVLHSPQLPAFAVWWGLLSGVSGGIALMLFYEALALGEMGLSAAIAGVLTAALPVAISWLRQGRPGSYQLAGFAVAAMAIALIAWAPAALSQAPAAGSSQAPAGSSQASIGSHQAPAGFRQMPVRSARTRGLVLSVLAGLGFGLQLVVLHLASEQGSMLRALALSRAGGAVAGAAAIVLAAVRGRGLLPGSAAPFARSEAHPAGQRKRSGRSFALAFVALATVAGLLDTGGNGLYMASAMVGRLDVAAVLASLYPGATILLAASILKERTSRLQTAGMVLALCAVVLISL